MRQTCSWQDVDAELERWHLAGREATLWWRDDDAAGPCAALERLVLLSRRWRVPLGLAVIPARAERSLAPLLAGAWCATALQHGYAHRDHAASDEPSAELGGHRPAGQVLAELGSGRDGLQAVFGSRFLPVLVPPWNRIADALLPALGSLGYLGLSRFAARAQARIAARVVEANCHMDPVDWKAGAVFRGEARSLSSLLAHLRARREGRVDAGEPTGLLTHHLEHGPELWAFLEELFRRLTARPAVRWLDPRQVFAA